MIPKRCAVYTRKSNEEGLDQAFNSLDAQREAGLDFIKSQKHEGWKAVAASYDDGGFSGGTMKRPALERLLADIGRGRIDVVVVYKVDRLSRSLSDFAGMMRLFDEKGVSFVSVTQQFNTTTSMGRLTLNMLLSFAQFEREVSGERIRDKIAATVKKGYWVCGQPPLGYRRQREGEERGLYVIPEEAALVREIHTRYIGTRSLVETSESLNRDGFRQKQWTSGSGRAHGGKPFTPKAVHAVLTHPLHIGKVSHTRGGVTTVHDGLHEPIIERGVRDRVRALMEEVDRGAQRRWTHSHLLKGKLRTHEGFAMSPSSVQRPLTKTADTGQKRHVRYYISQKAMKRGFKTCELKTINAGHLEDLVRAVVLDHAKVEALEAQPAETRDHWIRAVLESVTLSPESIVIRLDPAKISELRSGEFTSEDGAGASRPTCPVRPEIDDRGKHVVLTLPVRIKKLDGRRVLLSPEGRDLVLPSNAEPKRHIVDAIGLAHRWQEEILGSGLSIKAFCAARDVSRTRILKLLPLTLLGPETLRAALTGTLPPSVTLECLLRAASETLDWGEQARMLRLASPRTDG